jgi:hypothetical protein
VKDGVTDWSHYFSKWIGVVIDEAVSTDPALVYHSFRHTLRERGRMLNYSPEVINALGGWAAKSVGERYGVNHITTLDEQLARIDFLARSSCDRRRATLPAASYARLMRASEV